MSNFPASLDNNISLPNPLPTDKTNAPSLSGLLTSSNGAVIAVETKLGTGASTAVANKLLIGTGAGASAWSKDAPLGDIVGTSDPQTLTFKTLTAPLVSNPVLSGTITGSYIIGGTPTINGAILNTATINNPTLSGTVTGTYTLGGTPTFPSSVVLDSSSQTLTNKTLSTGSVIDAAVDVTAVLQKVYPIGAIYISTVATNPNTLFGFGTWTAYAEGRTIFGKAAAGTFASAGSTGGQETVNLQHAHATTSGGEHTHSTGGAIVTNAISDRSYTTGSASPPGHYHDIGFSGSHGHSISSSLSTNQSVLDPYIVSYIWQRTA